MLKAVSFVFAAIPFAFGGIRAVQTGTDVRYLWVALGGMAGRMIAVAVSPRLQRARRPFTVAAAVFILSTGLAVAVGRLLGTMLGPGLLVVAAGFGGCFAASAWFSHLEVSP